MRSILAILLFQFFAPGFLPVGEAHSGSVDKVFICEPHNDARWISLLYLEVEEKEWEEQDRDPQFFPVPTIDLSDLSRTFTRSQERQLAIPLTGIQFDSEPPLFVLHCTYLI